ncbi:hypothetical protein ACWAUC_15180 [Bradyrhizobium guangdongense]
MDDRLHQVRASSSSPAAAEFDPHRVIETTEQLRIAIDQGYAGDKVDASDPAAAPLGTDDEAGGTSDTPAQVRLAAAQELRATADRQRTSGIGPAWWLIGFILSTGLGIVASLIWVIS